MMLIERVLQCFITMLVVFAWRIWMKKNGGIG